MKTGLWSRRKFVLLINSNITKKLAIIVYTHIKFVCITLVMTPYSHGLLMMLLYSTMYIAPHKSSMPRLSACLHKPVVQSRLVYPHCTMVFPFTFITLLSTLLLLIKRQESYKKAPIDYYGFSSLLCHRKAAT